jgi:hypothetical protein
VGNLLIASVAILRQGADCVKTPGLIDKPFGQKHLMINPELLSIAIAKDVL